MKISYLLYVHGTKLINKNFLRDYIKVKKVETVKEMD